MEPLFVIFQLPSYDSLSSPMKILGCIDEVSGCATLEKLKKLKGLFGYFLLLGSSFRDMDSYILTCFHHGGCVVGNPNPTYQREVDVFGVGIDKDNFSLVEFLSYTKDLGYTNVKGFYCEDNNELVQVTSDTQLLEFVKDLVDGDEFHVYVVHEVDELEELLAPTGLLPWSDPIDESVGINTEGTVENDSDLNEVDTELHGGDTNQNEAESDLPSSDTDLDVIPDEDDSDVDEELRSLRAERRNKRNPNLRKKRDREKKTITKEVPIGEAGVDRGFEDIGINKKDRYVGRLGEDEKYIDSSECDNDDNTDMLDAEAVRGVDLPGRRKSKKARYDDECTVAIFELGMIFENAKEFRKALAKYAIEKNYQIKLRPNEAHRVRAKCKFKEKCKWLCYGAIDRDSGNFMIKNYYPIHKCLPSNKNKMCTTKFLASRFKDEITRQPSLRIWEIQELCREKLGLQVGRTICYKAKMMILRENMGDWNMEFARLCDYAEVIKQTNPGSSVWVRMDRETVPGKNLFVYFYVCLDALKKGWKEGCRRIIGFDGYFLKGACKGELLVAVGRNGNNQMFPIAWAVMDKETKHSWTFFINYLKKDLQLGTGHGLTVMSAMQKYRHTINLTNRVCSCRTWQLRGIPCQHAISALYHIEQEPEPLVEHWYKKDTFLKAYSHLIQPIPNMKMWLETNNPRIEPPEPKQMPSRPPRNRIKSHNKKYCKVGVHTSQLATHNSQFTAGQNSQGSCHPEPTSSFQLGQTRFNQPASTTSNNHASLTTVCDNTSRVKRARETAKTSQPPPFVDTSIPVTRGITSQLPPKTRQTAGQKRGRVATEEDSTRGGPKRPTNGGSSNVGFGIYTSASGTKILNPGTSSQMILPTGSSYKDASLTSIDLGFKPRGLRWKNKDAITTSQLQQMANKKKK
ncbi:hypothetical protein MTR67_020214 [Solanum verrucosum]|uniref:SWIM-type domain-containing protein n=1 Tax=Solanum verrucosum TaxID=315347 RepID=A0AAF0TP88_SOLVR|nr:hypothetical protein MTR67_020214 [Solanum verrucosum]